MLLLGPILILLITVLIVLAALSKFFVKSTPARLSKDHLLTPPTPSEPSHSDSQDSRLV